MVRHTVFTEVIQVMVLGRPTAISVFYASYSHTKSSTRIDPNLLYQPSPEINVQNVWELAWTMHLIFLRLLALKTTANFVDVWKNLTTHQRFCANHFWVAPHRLRMVAPDIQRILFCVHFKWKCSSWCNPHSWQVL